jgi:chemotaxis response regulator CheB
MRRRGGCVRSIGARTTFIRTRMSGLSRAQRRPREYRPQPDNANAGFLSHCYRNPDMTDQPEAEPEGFPTPTSGRFSVVVIAASAGGLAAITAVLANSPLRTQLSVIPHGAS